MSQPAKIGITNGFCNHVGHRTIVAAGGLAGGGGGGEGDEREGGGEAKMQSGVFSGTLL